jgi:hypothetical protein
VERWKAWDEDLLMREGFQEVVYMQKILVPTQDTKINEYTSLKIKWKINLSLVSQTTVVNKNIYQQGKNLTNADITTQITKYLLRNKA